VLLQNGLDVEKGAIHQTRFVRSSIHHFMLEFLPKAYKNIKDLLISLTNWVLDLAEDEHGSVETTKLFRCSRSCCFFHGFFPLLLVIHETAQLKLLLLIFNRKCTLAASWKVAQTLPSTLFKSSKHVGP